MQCYFGLCGLFGVPVLAGSACKGKRCFPGPVTGCFLVVEDLRAAVRKMISEPSTCCGRISLPGWESKHYSGCVLVVTGSLLHVSLGIHDVFRWGQEVSRSKEQLFWWIFSCLWHDISLWGKGVSSLHRQRGYKGWTRWCGGIPLVGATWPPCIHPLEGEVSDAAEKESASPAVVQSMPCVFLGILVQSKGDIHLPGLLSVARWGSRKIWVWITSCCWVRKCKMQLRCAIPPVLGYQTNFPPSYPLSEFSSSYFGH